MSGVNAKSGRAGALGGKFGLVSVRKSRLASSRRPIAGDDDDKDGAIARTVGSDTQQEWLLKNRTIRLDGEVNTASAIAVIQAIHHLEGLDPKKPIRLLINSPGGHVADGFAIIDTMRASRCPIETYACGEASSMASLILCAGDAGRRFVSPNTEIMIHQPLTHGVEGSASDIEIAAKDMADTRARMIRVYVEQTNIAPDVLARLIDRNNALTPWESKEIGLVDEVLTQEAYFRKIHGMDVPAHKKIPYPQPPLKSDDSALSRHFNALVAEAVKSRGRPANDNANAAKPRKTRVRAPQKKS